MNINNWDDNHIYINRKEMKMNTSRRIYCLIIAVVITLMAGGVNQASALLLTIDNADFEAAVLDPSSCGTWFCTEIPEWEMTGDAGIFNASKPGQNHVPQLDGSNT